ncbi:MAG: DUF2079 domain-containing protein [Candidatus Eremiobacteraeota bacterium]|nr:DUF2079 domain-containing protein [Candidatus Eremiobacteraeota bacterium]
MRQTTAFTRIWLGSATYFVIFSVLGIDRYLAHRSAEDFGIFFQTIASAFGGFSNTIEGANHFTVHFSPILYLLAPLVTWMHSPLPLVLVSAAANATVAPALFLIARRRVAEKDALAIAALAFIYPPLCGVTFADFHENSLVVPMIAWLLYALDARKFGVALIFMLLALLTKEDEAIFIGSMAVAALYYFAARHERRGVTCALMMLGCSIVVFAGYFLLVRPLAGAHEAWHPLVMYAPSQAQPESLTRAIGDRIGYLFLAFVPLLFLPFLSRILLLAVLPFAEVLSSSAPVTYTMGQHYAAVWIPYVLVAFTLGTCRLLKRKAIIERRMLAGCLIIALGIFAVANPLHPRYFLRWPGARDAQLDRFINSLPHDREIGTQEEAYTHMGFFPGATLGIEQHPDYALFDWQYPDSNWVIRDGPRIRAERAAGRYRLVRAQNGIELYERIGRKPAGTARRSPAW